MNQPQKQAQLHHNCAEKWPIPAIGFKSLIINYLQLLILTLIRFS